MRLECQDGTRAFTEDGDVSFTVPPYAVQGLANGQEGAWIRGRLIAGNYGEDERFASANSDQPGQGPRWLPSTLAPPAIKSIEVASFARMSAESPEALIAHNNLSFEKVDLGSVAFFSPFHPLDIPCRSVYFGFKAPTKQALADRKVDLYFHSGAPPERLFNRDERGQSLPALVWQYWAGNRWHDAEVTDGTACLTQSGIVTVQIGDDLSRWKESSITPELYWLRVLWTSGDYPYSLCLRRVAVNTVPATHTVTLENERLGSSNGVPRQTFRTARVPVLGGIKLEVREPGMPPADECARLRREEGEDAISVLGNPNGRVEEIWVRWHQVDDFLSSGGTDRHYVVNRLTGEIQFGDGKTGRIPPKGANTIKMRSYRTGGGAAGNKPIGSVTQLRTTIPFVASAVNLESASGGQDIEDWDSVRKRGPRCLRHRGRAVTEEDYQDLALESSPAVARAKCYSSRDLVKDPSGSSISPGVVSLVIVPGSTDTCPKPTAELLLRVR
ncbi:MAG: baseplate J/gp47 family protein, partial [Pseudomonadota bacterium]